MLKFFRKDKKTQPVETVFTAQDWISSIIEQSNRNYYYAVNDIRGNAAFVKVSDLPVADRRALCLELLEVIPKIAQSGSGPLPSKKPEVSHLARTRIQVAIALLDGLIRRKLGFEEADWMGWFRQLRITTDAMVRYKGVYIGIESFPINYAIKQIEYHLKNHEPSKELISFIQEILKWEEMDANSGRGYWGADMGNATGKLRTILAPMEGVPEFQLLTEDMGSQFNALSESIQDDRKKFDEIFHLASNATTGKPSKKFTQSVTALQDEIGPDVYRTFVQEVLQMALSLDFQTKTHTYESGYVHTEVTYLCKPSQQFIKGLVWTMARYSDRETLRLLTALCEKSFQKIPGVGPAAMSLGNACLYALGNMRGKDGLGALAALKLKVRQNTAKKAIDQYLTVGAEKYKVSVEELKEMAVPEYKLERGEKFISFDDYQLRVFIDGAKVANQWIKPDGQSMKSVPSIVKNKESLTQKLKTVRKELKDIQKTYSAQKQRLDNLFTYERIWDWKSFQRYYLHHGLMAPIAEKLIWKFTNGGRSVEGIFQEGEWRDVNLEPILTLNEETSVQLWHPVHADEETILKWRELMIQLEWKQPIKQAFREIYILTEAELNTHSYSNRMAAHILKQHQFSSLAMLRDWKYSLMGAYDDGRYHEVCSKFVAEYGIRAEFWIDEVNQDDAFNDTGIWDYVATDQVKFIGRDEQPIPLDQVPATLFTEIMRDVDMFVGVCSVGNDPLWIDNNGARQANRDYWMSYSFGDLSEIAKTRKTILERLLPRLKKIRDKATIDGKFLVVQGKLRTYKIHIGSGNILMEPNDQYLCIVPARSAEKSTDRLFIPFEGDKGLSIVLSKAFLLAEDDKITDPTITSQINR
ncbi:DUF4132 domain-containing protein [Pontibacter sp. G13]|uniref:DUF4132 domain-containing protein n=1 Tax=Pontibacter sp. G13 TaxID=3074898 RepID=UPI00288C3BAB|nr:DUF4132 domain-containing protein [Pontibacter sp. G13]WNJ18314.1 DUF4132 domain-containing protein [Pontibacter sp. G13]